MQQVFDMTLHHVMSWDTLTEVVFHCLARSLGFGVPFSHDDRVFVCSTGMVPASHAKPTASMY